MSGTPEQFAGNLDYWEQAAATHGTTDTDIHYHFDEVVAGGTLMTGLEARGLADATGASYDAPLATEEQLGREGTEGQPHRARHRPHPPSDRDDTDPGGSGDDERVEDLVVTERVVEIRSTQCVDDRASGVERAAEYEERDCHYAVGARHVRQCGHYSETGAGEHDRRR